jgi:hypothetical protein
VRLTDSGVIASFIYYYNPAFFPIAHNVQFVISVGYWTGKLLFNMEETNEVYPPEVIPWYINLWTYFLHIAPYSLLLNEIRTFDQCHNYFTLQDLLYSINWLQYWFIYVYMPWRLITKDAIYSVISSDKSVIQIVGFIGILHLVMFIGHIVGKTLLYVYC